MRKKIPENESDSEREIRLAKEKISSFATRGERLAWDRKLKKMEKFIEELVPVEDKILEIIKNEKYPIMDKIEAVRKTMILECVHPENYLIVDEDWSHAHCKFCGKNIRWR
jgi:hypothetical protein